MSDRTEQLIEGALWWAEAGVPCFPCNARKAPLTSDGFKSASADPATLRALFEFYGEAVHMVGARMGKESGLFAVDFDTYKGAEPQAYMQGLVNAGVLPQSREHSTRSGGKHMIYRSDVEWPNLQPCSGVDVKGEGGYIIVPPSGGYTVVHEGIVDAPQGLLDMLKVARTTASNKHIDDLKLSIGDASDFHDAILAIASRLSARGIAPHLILTEIRDVLAGSTAKDPNHVRHGRWKALMSDEGGELSRVVRSGYEKYNPQHKTNKAREQYQEQQERWEDTAHKAGFDTSPDGGNDEPIEYDAQFWPFEGYWGHEAHDLEDQNFTMYPIFAENESVVLFAEPKTGKTAVALTTALCIACGFDLGELKVSDAGSTLYYALEGTRAIRLRVAAWKKMKIEEGVELPKHIPMFVIEGHANFLKEENRNDEAAKIIAANKYSIANGTGPLKAVYLDTLTKAMSGGDQNSVEDTSHLFELIGLLRAGRVTATIIFVHHKSRQGNARGSTNIEAEPDVLLDISKDGDLVNMRIARARSIEDGGSYMFKLSGVDLGTTSQGHPLAGVYATPVAAASGTTVADVAMSFAHAEQMKNIVAMGEGQHTIQKVLTVLNAAGIGPKKGPQIFKPTQWNNVVVQMFFTDLIPVKTGRVYGNNSCSLVLNDGGKVTGIKIM